MNRKLALIGAAILLLVILPGGTVLFLFSGSPTLAFGPYRGAERLSGYEGGSVEGTAEAGGAVLRDFAAARGFRLDPRPIARELPDGDAVLAELQRIARDHGVVQHQWRPAGRGLSSLPTPAITVLDGARYVLVERVARTGAVFVDPEHGRFRLDLEEFRARWEGWALTLS